MTRNKLQNALNYPFLKLLEFGTHDFTSYTETLTQTNGVNYRKKAHYMIHTTNEMLNET